MFSIFSKLSSFQNLRPTSHKLWRYGLPLLLCALTLSGTTWWALRGAQAQNNRASMALSSSPTSRPATNATRTATSAAVKLEAQQGCTVNCGATVPASGSTAQAVAFAATATTTGCSTQPTYQWDFGDGSPLSTQQNPSKTYTAGGTYNWRLTASVSSGGTNIDTVVGGVGEGAPAKQSPYLTPYAVAADVQNRGVYVLENGENATLLRFINTTNQPVTLGGRTIDAGINRAIVGGGSDELGENISGLNVQLADAFGLAAHPNGNLVYFVVQNPPRVRALNISAANQTVGTRTVAPGNVVTLAEIAAADSLNALAINSTGDVFTASPVTNINRVYRISPTGQVSNFAGSGANTRGTDAFAAGAATGIALLQPRALAIDSNNNVYIADASHQRVIRVDTGGAATLVTQFPQPATGQGFYPSGLAFFSGTLYMALGNQQTIVRPDGGTTATVRVAGTAGASCEPNTSSCGDGGAASSASFFLQSSVGTPPFVHIAASSNGLFIPDQGSILRGRVRFLNLTSAAVTLAGTTTPALGINTIAGNGLQPPYDGVAALATELRVNNGVAVDANNNLWLADSSSNRIRFVNRSNSEVTLFPNTPAARLIVPAGAIVTVNKDVGVGQGDDTTANQMFLNAPQGLFITNRGLYIVETLGGGTVGSGNNARKTGRIRFLNLSNTAQTIFGSINVPVGQVASIVGGGQDPGSIGNGGPALSAKLLGPSDVVVNANDDVYIADPGNKAVRKVNGSTGIVSSVALDASDYVGLALDNSGRLYAVDNDRNRVWRESAANSNSFTTMSTDPLIYRPRDLVVDASGNAYVLNAAESSTDANPNAHRIIRVTPAGAASLFAGSTIGFGGDGGPANAAKLNIYSSPFSLVTVGTGAFADSTINMAINGAGEIFFSDISNRRIRRIASGETTCTRTGTITISGDNLPPTLAAITPSTRGVGTPGNFTITATGTNFVASSVVRWNGQDRLTTFVSSTQLTAQIQASDVATIGSANVTVFTPAPGGGASGSQTFTIQSCNPVPSIDSVAPNTIVVNTAFRVTVNGAGFRPSSVVRWEGQSRPTTYVNETQLTAQIPASDAANTGTFDVNVFTSEPCGGASSNARFSVTATNAVPAISLLAPANVNPGGAAFVLTVSGLNFALNSIVRWNGQDRSTTFVNATQLTAQVSAADVASPTVARVTVFSPTPGGGVTTPLDFYVGGPAAAVSAASYARPLAPESISAMFGTDLASGVAVAQTVPLPTTLLGTTVTVRDVAGMDRPAPLFFVAPGQINFLVPPGTALGLALITARAGDGKISVAAANIEAIQPALFTVDASGTGLASALALRVKPDGTLIYESLVKTENGQIVAAPIDLGPATDVVFIIGFGTGIRGHASGSLGTATLGGQNLPSAYAGPQGELVGLDQLNLGAIPRSLIGRGSVELAYTLDGKNANVVTVSIK